MSTESHLDAALRLLPAKQRAQMKKKVANGQIRSPSDLLALLVPELRAKVQAALLDLPPDTSDLMAMRAGELLGSVGLPRDPGLEWVPVHRALQAAAASRSKIEEALKIRAARRDAGWRHEQARKGAREAPPEPRLVPLHSALSSIRATLRSTTIPEGELDQIELDEVDPAEGDITFADPHHNTVIVKIIDKISVRSHTHAWALAAIDLLLDTIATPGAPLRAQMLEILSKPPWERELARLDASIAELQQPEAPIGWRFVMSAHGSSIRPVSCSTRARGGYSLRNLSLRNISEAMLVHPADERLLDLLSWTRSPSREVIAVIAELLVDHPRVFSGAQGAKPMTIRRRTLALSFGSQAGDILPHIEIDGQPVEIDALSDIARSSGTTWLRLVEGEQADELQIIPIRRSTAAILLRWLGQRQPLPMEALGALSERLPALGTLVPVKLSEQLHGRALTPDERPLLRVRWDGSALDLDVRLRLLPELAPVEPGAGLPELVTVRDGHPCHVARDLASEPSRVEEKLAPLGLIEADRKGFRWSISSRERALIAISAIAEAKGDYQTEWEGSPPSIRKAHGQQMKIRVRSERGWFGLSGEAKVDQTRVPLEAVLEAVREGSSFIQVKPGHFVQLARDLAARLAPIAAAEEEGKLSALHAPVIEALAEAEVKVEADEPLKASLKRLKESASLELPAPEMLRAELRHYQQDGFLWLARLAQWAPGAVLADDMSLGKTVQAIALLCYRSSDGPALVVSPLSVASNWAAELARFAPDLRVVRYRGPGRAKRLSDLGPGSVVLATWDLLARDEELTARAWTTAVLDEAQAIKNASTARAKGASRLQSGFVVALTGTPVENRAEELWSLLRAVTPGLLGSEKRFDERFASPIAAGLPGAREALARIVRPFVLRRTKAEVAPELPSRTEVVLRVPLSSDEAALYERARLEAVEKTAAARGPGQRFEIFRWLTQLRQLACNPRLVDPGSPIASSKLEMLRKRVADLRGSGHRALIFSQFVRHLELAREALVKDGVSCKWLTGDSGESERQREVAAFQAGEGDVFLLSLGAGGTGLNLTAATYVFHLDPWWNPAKEDQASDRSHRIGQTQPVTIYRLVAEGTIEEKILALHAEKRDLADALLSGADGASRASLDELVALIAESAPVEPQAAETPAAAPPAAAPPAARLPSTPPAAPPAPPAAPPPQRSSGGGDWRERFLAHLAREVKEGRIQLNTANQYTRAAERMFAWVGPVKSDEELVQGAKRWLASARTGSDKLYGGPSVRRLLALVEGTG